MMWVYVKNELFRDCVSKWKPMISFVSTEILIKQYACTCLLIKLKHCRESLLVNNSNSRYCSLVLPGDNFTR